jgi:hypothetical protein
MLCRAFEEAKQFAYQRMANVRVVPLPWFAAHWEDERALFGPDPWVYGLGEANRKTIETAVRYTHEQGMTSAPMPIEQMFVFGLYGALIYCSGHQFERCDLRRGLEVDCLQLGGVLEPGLRQPAEDDVGRQRRVIERIGIERDHV